MKKSYSILALLFAFVFASGQEQEDVSQYFDDGGASSSSNVICINALSPVVGDMAVYYERVFDQLFALEIGVGYIPYYGFEMPEFNIGDIQDFELKTFKGYSYRIHPKYYIQKMGPEFNSTGIMFRKRVYNEDDVFQTIHNDFAAVVGTHLFLGSHFIFEYDIGLGYRMKVQKENGVVIEKKGGAVVPFHLKIGVKF